MSQPLAPVNGTILGSRQSIWVSLLDSECGCKRQEDCDGESDKGVGADRDGDPVPEVG